MSDPRKPFSPSTAPAAGCCGGRIAPHGVGVSLSCQPPMKILCVVGGTWFPENRSCQSHNAAVAERHRHQTAAGCCSKAAIGHGVARGICAKRSRAGIARSSRSRDRVNRYAASATR